MKIKFLRNSIIIIALLLLVGATYASSLEVPNRLIQYGIVKYNPAGYALDQGLTREQALVLFIRTMNESDLASKYSTNLSKFSDVARSAWYNADVVYGTLKGYTVGVGSGRFGTGQGVTSKEFLTFVLRGLNFQLSDSKIMETARDLGLLTNLSISPYHYLTRAEAFSILDKALDLPKLGTSINLAMQFNQLAPESLEGNKIVEALALDTNTIKVTFQNTIAMDERPFKLTDRYGKQLSLSASKLLDYEHTLILNTSGMQVGQAYTLSYGTESKSLVPLMVNYTDYPRMKSVEAINQNRLRVFMTTPYVDKSSLNTDNFKLDGDVVVTDVSIDYDYMAKNNLQYQLVLTIGVTAMESGKTYTLQASNLKSYKEISGASGLVFVSTILDDKAPVLVSATVQSSNLIKLNFSDSSNLDFTSILPSNVSISPVLNIHGMYQGTLEDSGYYSVYIITDHMVADTSYEITAHRVSDGVNIMNGAQRVNFTGVARYLNLVPQYARAISKNSIEIGFMSEVHADSLNPAWFTLNNGLTVSKVEYASEVGMPNGINKKKLIITSQVMPANQVVEIYLNKNLKDVDGLGMLDQTTLYVASVATDGQFDAGVVAVGIDEMQVKILFAEKIEATSALNLGHYRFNDTNYIAGAQLLDDGKTVVLTVPYSEKGSLVKISIDGVTDLWGNQIPQNTYVYCVIP